MGAIFWGNPADTTYRWSDAPQFAGGYGVWDVTDPAAPIALAQEQAPLGFQDTETRPLYCGGPRLRGSHPHRARGYNPLTAASVPAA